MQKLKIPEFFKYKQCEDLVRIGSKDDGGYLISESDLRKSDALLSFGIDVNWEFEEEFFKNNKLPVYAYDASTNFLLFVRRAIGSFLRYDFKKSFFFLTGYIKLKKFFTGKKHFYQKFIGLDNNKNYLPLHEVINEKNYSNYFIKMDIEGSEYRCLEDLIKYQDTICGMVIEFHDVDLHLNKIEKFISRLNLNIAHIHINNWTLVGKNDLPLILEITFSRYGKIKDRLANHPHELDSPNSSSLPDFIVSFEK